MAIDKAKAALNFSGGIHAVSYVNRARELPNLPQTKRIIYFTDDASPSHLSQLFRCYKGRHLVDKVCRPNKNEVERLQTTFSGRQALNALHWFQKLEKEISPELKHRAEGIFTQLAELELKEQVQRNLLKKV